VLTGPFSQVSTIRRNRNRIGRLSRSSITHRNRNRIGRLSRSSITHRNRNRIGRLSRSSTGRPNPMSIVSTIRIPMNRSRHYQLAALNTEMLQRVELSRRKRTAKYLGSKIPTV
jgi:hypothetical protein